MVIAPGRVRLEAEELFVGGHSLLKQTFVLYGMVTAKRAETQYTTLVPKTHADGNDTVGIRLPDIAVPLASPDPDVKLALQPLVEAVYARARYHRSIDYAKPLTPPLGPEESAWLEQQLRARQPQT